MTFDVASDVFTGSRYDWQSHHEASVICRRCRLPSIIKVELVSIDLKGRFQKDNALKEILGDLEPGFRSTRFVDVSEVKGAKTPADLPPDVETAFSEAARCLAIGCFNAAGAMFRLSLDLATKNLLPQESVDGSPSNHERRNLAPRLNWLFEQAKLPADLKSLSSAVKDNGDYGVHEGSLDENDASDLLDFSTALLERMFSEPARIAAAAQRKALRREAR
jgi:Domain of unknown function (DUF4145)